MKDFTDSCFGMGGFSFRIENDYLVKLISKYGFPEALCFDDPEDGAIGCFPEEWITLADELILHIPTAVNEIVDWLITLFQSINHPYPFIFDNDGDLICCRDHSDEETTEIIALLEQNREEIEANFKNCVFAEADVTGDVVEGFKTVLENGKMNRTDLTGEDLESLEALLGVSFLGYHEDD